VINHSQHIAQCAFLVQQFTAFDEKGDGAWVSLKMFPTKELAEKHVASFQSGLKIRVLEVVCEATR
jgi:hypothetical protein